MILPAIYIILYFSTVALFFVKGDRITKFKKGLITAHVSFLILLLLDILLINSFKGVWFDRLIVISFLLTASAIFPLYRKTLPLWQKIYFGIFLLYPATAALTFFIDKIMFVIVASPLIATLTVPTVRFSNKKYEVRENIGVIAPMRLELIKKGFITEKALGICSDEDVVYKDISSLIITNQSRDTTNALITSKGKTIQVAFIK